MAFFLHEDLIFVSSQGCFTHPAQLVHAPSIRVVPHGGDSSSYCYSPRCLHCYSPSWNLLEMLEILTAIFNDIQLNGFYFSFLKCNMIHYSGWDMMHWYDLEWVWSHNWFTVSSISLFFFQTFCIHLAWFLF